jgi:hypothetical protein
MCACVCGCGCVSTVHFDDLHPVLSNLRQALRLTLPKKKIKKISNFSALVVPTVCGGGRCVCACVRVCVFKSVYICINIFIYIYIERERERDQIHEVQNILLKTGAAEARATFEKLGADTYIRIHIR